MILAHELVPPAPVRRAVERGLDGIGYTARGRALAHQLLSGPHDADLVETLGRWFARHAEEHPNYEVLGGAVTRSWARRLSRALMGEQSQSLDELLRAPAAPPEGEEARAAAWGDYILRVHRPRERVLERSLRIYLRRQAARMARRVPAIVEAEGSRAAPGGICRISEDALSELLDMAEEERLLAATTRRPVLQALRAAIRRALQAMALSEVTVPAAAVDELVDAQIGQLIVQVSETTVAAVKRIVEQGLAAGASVNDIQGTLQQSAAFGRPRALTIARTETTRSVSAGTQRAMEASVEAGAKIRKQWLSARDSAVRPTHVELDGQEVDVSADFVSSSGARGPGPGQMGDPAEDVNERCTVLPRVVQRPS